MWILPQGVLSKDTECLSTETRAALFAKNLSFRSHISTQASCKRLMMSKTWSARIKLCVLDPHSSSTSHIVSVLRFYIHMTPSLWSFSPTLYLKMSTQDWVTHSNLLRASYRMRVPKLVWQNTEPFAHKEIAKNDLHINPRWIESLMGIPIGWVYPSAHSIFDVAYSEAHSSSKNWATPRVGMVHALGGGGQGPLAQLRLENQVRN